MCTTLDGVNVVDIRVNTLIVGGVVGHRHLYRDALFLGDNMDHIINQFLFGVVDIANKLFQPFCGVENLTLVGAVLLLVALVGEAQGNACVQESQLTEASRQNVVLIFGDRED